VLDALSANLQTHAKLLEVKFNGKMPELPVVKANGKVPKRFSEIDSKMPELLGEILWQNANRPVKARQSAGKAR
jgi:hypothetical protein